MIHPPRFRGAAFSEGSDGDLRHGDRHHASEGLGIPPEWATVDQVHGPDILVVGEAGLAGSADGLLTVRRGVPLAVFTADCLGVVLEADHGVGVAHAGWRGLASGVLGALQDSMDAVGCRPTRAAVGPSIGPCCFEVGAEVVAEFPDHAAMTTWGTPSVDLWSAARSLLGELDDVWVAERCTRCDPTLFSHRRDGTLDRLAAIAWVA